MVGKGRRAKVWTEKEDKILKDIKESCDSESWSVVSKLLEQSIGVTRSAKQCRDRYFNYLTNDNNNSTWKDSEIEEVFACYLKHGTKWSLISKEIQSKNESQIKNLFYATIRRNIRKFNKGKLENEKITLKSLIILENNEIREILTAKKKIPKHFFSSRYLSSTAVQVVQNQGFSEEEEKNSSFELTNSNFEMKDMKNWKEPKGDDTESLNETDDTWDEEQLVNENFVTSYFLKLDEIEPVLFY
jgi:hypothetical protein